MLASHVEECAKWLSQLPNQGTELTADYVNFHLFSESYPFTIDYEKAGKFDQLSFFLKRQKDSTANYPDPFGCRNCTVILSAVRVGPRVFCY